MRNGALCVKKQVHCEHNEEDQGENGDHPAIDPEHRLLLSFRSGKRTTQRCQEVVDEVKQRTKGRTDILITSEFSSPL